MAFFDIDYDALVHQLLPVRLRKQVTTVWLRVLVSPVKWLYTRFKANRKSNLYGLAHNGQLCFMEAALNDAFDPIPRRIYITDGPFVDPLFVYLAPEAKPVWLGLASEAGSTPYPDPQWLCTDAETYTLGICFVVNVPAMVVAGAGYDMRRIRALIDLYRLPGRFNYSIVTF